MKSAKQKERELIIELSDKNKTVRDIAFDLGISKSKASFWINRFKKTKSLEDQPRNGRPTPLTERKLKDIFSEIKSKISKNKKKKAGISSKDAQEIIGNKIGRKYTLRHTQRILRKIGFSLITPRNSHIRKDKKAQDKFRQEFKKNSRRNIWAIQS